MKNLRPFLFENRFAVPLIIAGLFFLAACSHQEETAMKPNAALPSYVIPSTMGEYNAGAIHNAICLYLLTHYDSNLYSGYPHKFSVQGYDSLFALFAADSLTAPTGPLSPSDLAAVDSTFNTTFSNGWNGIFLTHAQLESTLYAAETAGNIASDEVEFIRNADSVLGLCSHFAISADTIASLQSQWTATTWTSSPTSGYAAYMYLSVASASNSFWGPGGAGSVLSPPVSEVIGDAGNTTNVLLGPGGLPVKNNGKAMSGGSAGSFSLAAETYYN